MDHQSPADRVGVTAGVNPPKGDRNELLRLDHGRTAAAMTFEVGRTIFELLGHVLADLAKPPAAGRAATGLSGAVVVDRRWAKSSSLNYPPESGVSSG